MSARPILPERREALLQAARFVVGEAGVEAGTLMEPKLAQGLAAAMAQDVAAAVRRRTEGATTLEELVDALIESAHEGAEPWRDGLALASLGAERVTDFGAWSEIMRPWLEAIETAIGDAQALGIVRSDVDAAAVALVVRDAVDRSARASLMHGRVGYRDAAAALIRAALRV
jgi:hypothetical protein